MDLQYGLWTGDKKKAPYRYKGIVFDKFGPMSLQTSLQGRPWSNHSTKAFLKFHPHLNNRELYVPGSKLLLLGMVIPPLIGNP